MSSPTAPAVTTDASQEPSQSSPSTRALPRLPLPDPICSNVPGTWAYDTMSRRVDGEILQRTEDDNVNIWSQPEFGSVRDRFRHLRRDLQNAATTPLQHLNVLTPELASDPERVQEWQAWYDLLTPHVNESKTWLTAPWMVTEFFVYRRLMETLDYWNPTSPGYRYDPFGKQKRAGLYSSPGSAEDMLRRLISMISIGTTLADGITVAAGVALWGNKMDLSLWPADVTHTDRDMFSTVLASANDHLLHNDAPRLIQRVETLHKQGGGRVDIIVDNAGFELVTDLALAQYLIQSGIAKTVVFQLKSHPTFVSDAMEADLRETVQYYANQLNTQQYPHCHQSGMSWQRYLDSGQWQCREHSFWVQGAAMWDMPNDLRHDLSQNCSLAFVKGDANYRRLLGDRQWDYTAPFEDVVGAYFPCPVCALRTLKAELGCGMDAAQISRAQQLDPTNWMTNGRFGVIHFGSGAGSMKTID